MKEENNCTCAEENKDQSCACEDYKCHEESTCGDESNCEDCTSDNETNETVEEAKDKKKTSFFKKDKHTDKLNEAYNQISILEDSLIRSKAELVNYRKRKDEEVSKMLKYANEDMIVEILPTIDNFERAIRLDNENLTDELSKFLEGFKMIYCALLNTMEKNHVKPIDGNNKPFDPTYHQAVMTTKVDDMESGMVVEVLQKGYLYKDKVIRTAMVRVSE